MCGNLAEELKSQTHFLNNKRIFLINAFCKLPRNRYTYGVLQVGIQIPQADGEHTQRCDEGGAARR